MAPGLQGNKSLTYHIVQLQVKCGLRNEDFASEVVLRAGAGPIPLTFNDARLIDDDDIPGNGDNASTCLGGTDRVGIGYITKVADSSIVLK